MQSASALGSIRVCAVSATLLAATLDFACSSSGTNGSAAGGNGSSGFCYSYLADGECSCSATDMSSSLSPTVAKSVADCDGATLPPNSTCCSVPDLNGLATECACHAAVCHEKSDGTCKCGFPNDPIFAADDLAAPTVSSCTSKNCGAGTNYCTCYGPGTGDPAVPSCSASTAIQDPCPNEGSPLSTCAGVTYKPHP